jgi:hypothetical protein
MSQDVLDVAIKELVPLCDATTADWDAVVRRAAVAEETNILALAPPSRGGFSGWRGLRRRSVVAALAAALVLAGAASAVAYHFLGPSPGFTGGISAFHRLSSIESLPSSMSKRSFSDAAGYAGISSTEALKRTYLLQHGQQGDLYALEGKNGTVCMFVAGRFASCLKINNAIATQAHPGVLATISPGYPRETPALVAVVADNVRTFTLIANATRRTLPIANNSVYVALPWLRRGDAISGEARYVDGSTRTFRLANPYGGELGPSEH